MKNNSDNPELEAKKKNSPGVLLQKAREAKEFTIENISTRLRLSQDVIEALESDHYEKLPAPIFVKGYIRSYAALVGLDANEVSDLYSESLQGSEAIISLDAAHLLPLSKSKHAEKKSWLLPLTSIALVAVLGVILWFSQLSSTDAPLDDKIAAMNDVVQESAIPTSEVQESSENPIPETVEPDQNRAEEPSPAPSIKAETSNNNTEAAEQVVSSAETTQNQSQPQPTQEEAIEKEPVVDKLVLEFNADSWVDVRDSTGKRLIYRMVKSGDKRAVAGTPPFKLTLGNAPEITLMRNGVKVDLLPYTRGKVAKFRLGKINE